MRIVTLVFFLCSVFVFSVFAQEKNTSVAHIPEFPLSLYKAATHSSQNLYNGRRYFLNDPTSIQHQFYGDRKWYVGSVLYDGQQFDSIHLMYDILKDELIIRDLDKNFMLLPVERVQSFAYNQHYFERLVSGIEIPSYMKTGFYDMLYNGNVKLIIQRRKNRQEKIIDMKLVTEYEPLDSYYIFRHNTYWPVKKKKSVLALFPEHARELKKAARKLKIPYRKNREQVILEMVKHYDEISK